MITLDPETLGQLDTRASRGTNGPAEPATATITPDALPRSTDGRPYARLTRLERLRLDGRADDAAEASDEDGEGEEGGEGQGRSGAVKAGSGEKDKHKMRGRNKSMKRFLRKKRKNVIDPTTVCPPP